ncbi:carbohydrate binding domain-containing protein [Deinococcus yavapaiensis]|uniref:Beta-glucanase (GH16 family) n=1 Tax=Deinococcus yavapaiensis KR-236 TaxID=694435 RepID=A0A318SD00_9DEIO|nr:carbohydrate binding domain-containing protein [Deinococcus yavapaiensis]PYE55274.1 beta-glucanase (GH16 family) [Deinococcus yavapaiensis KR-236]
MSKARVLLVTLTFMLAASGTPTLANSQEASSQLVWSDEFSSPSLDLGKWSYQLGNGFMSGNQYVAGWGNNELEYYTDRSQNVSVEDGHLVITARREAYTGQAGAAQATFDWTSGRLRTAGKFSRAYGKFEIRAKLPTGKGLWPAIWMLPEEPNPYGGWAASGEIDIIEGWGSKPNRLGHTIHYGGIWPGNIYSSEEFTFPASGTVADWHTYTLEWRPGEIRWYVDGQLTSTRTRWWSSSKTAPQSEADLNAWPAPFDRPFHLLLNLAVGGNFDGNPDASTPNEARMLVDYVRVSSLPDEGRAAGQRPDMTYPWTPSTTPARPALPDGNLVYNGGFDWTDRDARVTPSTTVLTGTPQSYFWTLFKSDGEATLGNDGGALKVDVTNPGSVNYAIQVRQDGLNIERGQRYEVSFDAWAATPRSAMIKVGGDANRGYAAYSGEQQVKIGTTRATQTLFFPMTATTDAQARLEFNLGAAGAGPVWIDNVRVRSVGTVDLSGRPPASDGNLVYNGAFTQDATSDEGVAGVARTAYWRTWNNPATGLNVSVDGGWLHVAVAHVDPTNNWHVQVNQPGVPLVQGRSYTLTFKGRADSLRKLGVVVGENGGSYARYLDQSAEVDTTERTYSYTFTAPTTNPAAILQILAADGRRGDDYQLYLRDFRLTQN